jgi:SAM-dependent methyltransferase
VAGRSRASGRAPSRPEFAEWDQWYLRRDYRQMPWFSAGPSPWVVRSIRETRLPSGSRVLDVGCGTGSTVLWLSRHGFRTSGIDVSPTALRVAESRARRAGLRVDLRVASVDRIPFPRGEFDFAIDTGCFHSIPLRLRERYAKEIARVVRTDGALLLTWIPREVRTEVGPPHRPSLAETASVFEPWFVFAEVHWHASDSPGGWKVYRKRVGRCSALLRRRRGRQPPPR